jgi:hypothetical protein
MLYLADRRVAAVAVKLQTFLKIAIVMTILTTPVTGCNKVSQANRLQSAKEWYGRRTLLPLPSGPVVYPPDWPGEEIKFPSTSRKSLVFGGFEEKSLSEDGTQIVNATSSMENWDVPARVCAICVLDEDLTLDGVQRLVASQIEPLGYDAIQGTINGHRSFYSEEKKVELEIIQSPTYEHEFLIVAREPK